MENNQIEVVNIVDKPLTPSVNNPERFGFKISGTGNGTKVCIVDSGKPNHDSIVNISDSINFTKSETVMDLLGHCTVLSGLIGGNKPDFIQGVAPDTSFFFSKSTTDNGTAAFDATIASVLWGVIREVNVIVMPLVIETRNLGLQEAINKAVESGITVIMALPHGEARYDNVLYVTPTIGDNKMSHFSGPNIISVPSCNVVSTYLEKRYAKVSGVPVSVAIAAGICLLAIEQVQKEKAVVNTESVLARISNSLNG